MKEKISMVKQIYNKQSESATYKTSINFKRQK